MTSLYVNCGLVLLPQLKILATPLVSGLLGKSEKGSTTATAIDKLGYIAVRIARKMSFQLPCFEEKRNKTNVKAHRSR